MHCLPWPGSAPWSCSGQVGSWAGLSSCCMRPCAAQPGLAGRPRAHALVVLVVKKNLARGHNRLASRRRPSHSPFCSQGPNVMEDQDLREIGISDAQHRRKLLQAARSLPKVPPAVPRPWRGAGRAWEPPRGVCPILGPPGEHSVLFTALPRSEASRAPGTVHT